MPKRHGRKARIWVKGYRLSPHVASFDEAYRADVAPVTTLENNDHVYVPGARGGEVRMSGFFDEDLNAIDEALTTYVGLGSENNAVLIAREAVQGAPGYGGAGGLHREYGITGPLAGPVGVTAAFLFSGRAQRVLVASGYATVTQAGTVAASLDTGVGTSPSGGDVHVQWDSISGTITLIVYAGAANLAETTPLGTVTMTAAGGVGGTVFGGTAAVGRYITPVWSTPGTGTAAFITAYGKR